MLLAHFIGKSPSAIKRAGDTLQWLVKFAEARRTITYGELSKLIGDVNPRTVVPRILGVIGNSLEFLSADIPPIQLLVVNKKDRIPGRSGLLGFLIKDKQLLERLSLEDKRHQWEVAKEKIFDWDWRGVLERFGLSPISLSPSPLDQTEAKIESLCSKGGPESEDHRLLKEYVASHPGVIGLKYAEPGVTERTILSGDRLDIFFELPEQWVGVEIKGKQSPEVDILRGLFQCVKYKAVLEAQRHYLHNRGKLPNIRIVLVLANGLPPSLERLRQVLNIEVKANVTVPKELSTSAR